MSTTTTPTPAPLISSSPANQATAAASGFSASGVMVLVIWLAKSLLHVDIPPEVATAMVGLIGTGIHWAVLKYGIPLAQ